MNKSSMSDITKTTIGLLVLAAIVAGIWYSVASSHNGKNVQLENDSTFPRYVYSSKKSLLAYRIAITMPDVLKALPCTCGCSMIGHTSNKDCFINDDGSYSPHAANCDVCQDIAIDAFKLYKNGDSLSKIKNFINEKYKQ